MDGRRQFGLGRRGQLEPGWRTGRRLGRHDSQRDAVALASASIGTVNSITDSSDLSLQVGGNEYGHHHPRQHRSPVRRRMMAGEGGTILNIGGTLTNSHYLSIGNATLSASDDGDGGVAR